MTDEQWKQLEAQFALLVELPKTQRSAHLNEIADAELRSELGSLLESAGEGNTVVEAVGRAATGIGQAAPGKRIGPYRIIRRLGQGGQGTVYEAARDDGAFEQQVALKILKWEIDSEAARARFRHERQILARLQHPNIARLLDGGQTEEGLPYLVMEYIDGRPITEAAAGWPLRRKLEMFLKVLAAVSFAHRNLIVHRDLKPGNILVTSDGSPRLLDFGIARLIDPEATQTATAMVAMTPDYASPEQIRGDLITTASDVYSLGVVLYELLAGRRPYEVACTTPFETYRTVSTVMPVPPRVSDDLDNVILMAMRKEPERRYTSAAEFGDDIQRCLEYKPVMARPDTILYRTRKYVRRHWITLVPASIALVGILAGSAVAIYQARQAQQRFEQVRKLAHSFVFDYQDDLAKLAGTTAIREKMARTALAYLDNLSASASNDSGLQAELAAAYQRVGDALGYPTRPNLGHTDETIVSYRKAAELHEAIAARQPAYRRELTGFYTDFAMLVRYTHDYSGAAKLAQSALQSAEIVARERPDDEAAQIRSAKVWCLLGDIDEELGHDTTALEKNQNCNASARAILARWHDRDALQMADGALSRVGTCSRASGRLSEAIDAFDKDEKVLNDLIAMEPANPRFRRALGTLAQYRSAVYYDDGGPNLGDPQRSLDYSRQYLDAMRWLVERDAKDASARFSLAVALFRYSFPLRQIDPKEAVNVARESVRLFDAEIAAGNTAHLVTSRRVRALRRLSEALLAAGQNDEAHSKALEVLEAQRKLAATDPKDLDEANLLVLSLVNAGETSEAAGDPDSAGKYLQEAETFSASIYSKAPEELTSLIPLVRTREALSSYWNRQGNQTQANHWHDSAARLWSEFPARPDYVQAKMKAVNVTVQTTEPGRETPVPPQKTAASIPREVEPVATRPRTPAIRSAPRAR